MLETQSVTMALTLLSLKVTQLQEKSEKAGKEWERMGELGEDLRTLADLYPDGKARSLAGRLRRLIATHGVIRDSKAELRAKCENVQASAGKAKDLAQQMRDLRVQHEAEEADRAAGEGGSRYRRALEQLSDPLLPVRGHALIELTRLVEARDAEAVADASRVFGIFRENLEDEDTYLYLQSIAGLVACAWHDPNAAVDLLAREFAHLDDRRHHSDRAVEIRTKIGEALVRVTRQLGELTPAFRNRLLNPFLSQMSHPDHLVRASCLSNLGELCKNLKFSLDGILSEVK